MKLVVQRVKSAGVEIDGKITAEISNGLLVLVGVAEGDDEKTADKFLTKLLKLRIFADENGKTNLSVKDIKGELLLVSQFTLLASLTGGNRPSFSASGSPEEANRIYQYMVDKAKTEIPETKQGVFGADMKIALINDGPFTLVIDNEAVGIK